MISGSKRKLARCLDDPSQASLQYSSPHRGRNQEFAGGQGGHFSVLPDEIIRALATYLGPSTALLRLHMTNRIFFGTLLDSCWEEFYLQEFDGFYLEFIDGCYLRSVLRPVSASFRYFLMKQSLYLFRACNLLGSNIRSQPTMTRVIPSTHSDDEIVYFNLRFTSKGNPVYVEITVEENIDNFSFSLVDFDANGRSSITFSPETGVIIKERKNLELPGKVEGLFSFPLKPTGNSDNRFTGRIGLYASDGKIAFFRQCKSSYIWETTNFSTRLSWLEAGIFTPCVAFRDKGDYVVSISRVGREPPISCSDNANLLDESEAGWQPTDWDNVGEVTR